MEPTTVLTDQNVRKGKPEILVSPRNPDPTEVVYLSNIDQTVAFSVETVFFYEAPQGGAPPMSNITERVKISVSEVLLIPYYFMAGRLNLNHQTGRLELVCNNTGVPFVAATSSLRLTELGDLFHPNPSFEHLILRIDGLQSLADAPIFTIQVTTFKCGGFSIGFMTNHSILDGRSAVEMFENLASACRGEGIRTTHVLHVDRSCMRARDPPEIKYQHTEYTKLADTSSFTSPIQATPPPVPSKPSESHSYKLFSFKPSMIRALKEKAMTRCSTFEAIVAHLWRARAKAVFDDPTETSSVLFAVDIRSKMSPPLPQGFTGNAVITASASARVADLGERPFSYCVGKVREAIERVSDEYVRSVVDWLEVYKGVPSTLNGSFYVSAWWKLPFHELDFGWGRPLYGGPVVSGMDEFVLLLSDGSDMGKEGGINVWIVLEEGKMERFMCSVFEM